MESLEQAKSYFDDALYERIKCDSCSGIADLFGRGLHLIAKAGEKVVGIVSFGAFTGGNVVMHPRIKQNHMIYALRVLKLSIDFVYQLKQFTRVLAIFPKKYKNNAKMAEKLGMTFNGTLPESTSINGKLHDQLIYSMGV